MPTANVDPIIAAIGQVQRARRRWEAADEGTPAWDEAEADLDHTYAQLFARIPISVRGMLLLIELAEMEGYDAEQVLALVRCGLRRMGG